MEGWISNIIVEVHKRESARAFHSFVAGDLVGSGLRKKMNSFKFILFYALVAVVATDTSFSEAQKEEYRCPDAPEADKDGKWTMINNTCYFLSTVERKVRGAVNFCKKEIEGGELASADTNNDVYALGQIISHGRFALSKTAWVTGSVKIKGDNLKVCGEEQEKEKRKRKQESGESESTEQKKRKRCIELHSSGQCTYAKPEHCGKEKRFVCSVEATKVE